MKRILWSALLAVLAGCGDGAGVSMQDNDRFQAGTWELESWLDAGQPADVQRNRVELEPHVAAMPPITVFFSQFYAGVKAGEIEFADGKVSGWFEQPRVDDISAHTVPITGSYDSTSFDVSFTYTAFGAPVRHIVKGKLVEGG